MARYFSTVALAVTLANHNQNHPPNSDAYFTFTDLQSAENSLPKTVRRLDTLPRRSSTNLPESRIYRTTATTV